MSSANLQRVISYLTVENMSKLKKDIITLIMRCSKLHVVN